MDQDGHCFHRQEPPRHSSQTGLQRGRYGIYFGSGLCVCRGAKHGMHFGSGQQVRADVVGLASSDSCGRNRIRQHRCGKRLPHRRYGGSAGNRLQRCGCHGVLGSAATEGFGWLNLEQGACIARPVPPWRDPVARSRCWSWMAYRRTTWISQPMALVSPAALENMKGALEFAMSNAWRARLRGTGASRSSRQ